MKPVVQLKRVYEKPSPEDGLRILVERLWPRGLTKSQAAVGLWVKDIAPSPELRKWFAHDPTKWNQFKRRYRQELRGNAQAVAVLRDKVRETAVTLVYAARDQDHNSAVALREFIHDQGMNIHLAAE